MATYDLMYLGECAVAPPGGNWSSAQAELAAADVFLLSDFLLIPLKNRSIYNVIFKTKHELLFVKESHKYLYYMMLLQQYHTALVYNAPCISSILVFTMQ